MTKAVLRIQAAALAAVTLVFGVTACAGGGEISDITTGVDISSSESVSEYSVSELPDTTSGNSLDNSLVVEDIENEIIPPRSSSTSTSKVSIESTTKPTQTVKESECESASEVFQSVNDDTLTKTNFNVVSSHDGYLMCENVWPSPIQFKIYTDKSSDYCAGDTILVMHKVYEISDNSGEVPIEISAILIEPSNYRPTPGLAYKPVIYLYPQEKTQVNVKVKYKGKFTVTIPEYNSGWSVTAYPDGTLINGDGKVYPYLFWEGEYSGSDYDFSSGFCVKGSDTESFLREKLVYMGLSEKETTEFLDFWLPRMQSNAYNRICFQTDRYTDTAPLEISPAPDSVLRVFMVYTPLSSSIKIKEQKLNTFERTGFSVVEWGGAVEY